MHSDIQSLRQFILDLRHEGHGVIANRLEALVEHLDSSWDLVVNKLGAIRSLVERSEMMIEDIVEDA